MSFYLNFGRYGGFYIHRSEWRTGTSWRVCLGWVALTYWPCDMDSALARITDAA